MLRLNDRQGMMDKQTENTVSNLMAVHRLIEKNCTISGIAKDELLTILHEAADLLTIRKGFNRNHQKMEAKNELLLIAV